MKTLDVRKRLLQRPRKLPRILKTKKRNLLISLLQGCSIKNSSLKSKKSRTLTGHWTLLNDFNPHRFRAALLGRDVEEDSVLSDDDVGHAVAVVRDGPESAAARDELRVLPDVQELAPDRGLRRGEAPRLAQDFL